MAEYQNTGGCEARNILSKTWKKASVAEEMSQAEVDCQQEFRHERHVSHVGILDFDLRRVRGQLIIFSRRAL